MGPTVAALGTSPATQFRRRPSPFARAQAADQHVWSAASVFMRAVSGLVLKTCACSVDRCTRERLACCTLAARRGQLAAYVCMVDAYDDALINTQRSNVRWLASTMAAPA
jgi:hypothetical protein